ncbi:hypothetical protein A2U01_0097956, partial [Trifolium medium]|nr:hypothetical protein [Trifolium medium]
MEVLAGFSPVTVESLLKEYDGGGGGRRRRRCLMMCGVCCSERGWPERGSWSAGVNDWKWE